jgi:hypothetical protein
MFFQMYIFQSIPQPSYDNQQYRIPKYLYWHSTCTHYLIIGKFVKNIRLRFSLFILILLYYGESVSAQTDSLKHKNDTLPDRFYVIQNVERDGEKLPEIEIKEVTISGKKRLFEGFQFRRYERMVYNVKKVYPYALIVRDKLNQVNSSLEKLPDEKQRKKYLKEIEKEVFRDYEDEIRNMTITQGKILIRLIDRETSTTSFDLIKEYRGKISASFWQGIARIFGTNLKEEYDPVGDDLLIEMIIREIEEGRL